MSRIGRKPIEIPKGISVEVKDNNVVVKGAKSELSIPMVKNISVEIKDNKVHVTRSNEDKPTCAAHGMIRAMINNMIIGVSKGFSRELEIQGVGYRAQVQGKKLVLNLGFSHTIEVEPPEGITFASAEPTSIVVSGPSKHDVGQMAAIIRGYRPPEPYQGKGIRYKGEYVIRKAGKTGTK